MPINFEPDLSWVDVKDPANPPEGAKLIGADNALLRYERTLGEAAVSVAALEGAPYPVRVDQSLGTQIFVANDDGTETRIFADTGWRDVTAELLNGWTAFQMLIRREMNTATLRCVSLNGAQATGPQFLPMMQGFYRTPAGGAYELPLVDTVSQTMGIISLGGNGGTFAAHNVTAASSSVTWFCDFDPWPNSLLGVPA